QSHRTADVLESAATVRAADNFCRHSPWPHLRTHQRCRRGISDQFRRPRPTHQRACRTLRSARDLCRDLFRDSGQRCVLHGYGKGRAMAETGRLRATPAAASAIDPVTLVRIVIIVSVLVIWEGMSRSGLLYRDVVPS